MNLVFLLRALAEQRLLRQRESRCCCGAGKPVIHANHLGEETHKGHLTRSNLRNPAASFMKLATDFLVLVG